MWLGDLSAATKTAWFWRAIHKLKHVVPLHRDTCGWKFACPGRLALDLYPFRSEWHLSRGSSTVVHQMFGRYTGR
jgi:hypothetical protein